MRQKNQVELNLGTGAKGEAPRVAAQETEAPAANVEVESPAAVVMAVIMAVAAVAAMVMADSEG